VAAREARSTGADHLEHDLSLPVAGVEAAVDLGHPIERQHRIDQR
jgi:hypothetical protein